MAGRIATFLFGGVFAAAGIGFFIFLVWPTLSLAIRVQHWQPAQATVQALELETHRGEDSTTYKVSGSYLYRWGDREYPGNRFSLMDMSDNIGSFHRDLYQQLDQARRGNKSVTVWVNPENPTESVVNRDIRWGLFSFVLVFVVVFSGIGLTIMFFSVKGGSRSTGSVDVAHAGGQSFQPWLKNKNWQSNIILSSAKTTVIVAWFFAAVLVAVSAPIVSAVPAELAKENYLILVALLFPLAGVMLTGKAIVETLRWQRFGRTPLIMDPFPGAIGGDIGGHFEINLPYDPALVCRITVNCVHSYMSGSGKNRSRREDIVWQDDGVGETRSDNGLTQVYFRFEVPDGLPASDVEKGNRYHLWRVHAHCELPGADFNRSFEIPVFPTAVKSSQHTQLSREHESLTEAAQSALETFLQISHGSGGVELYMPMGRRIGASVIFALVGSIFLVAGIAVLRTGGPGFLGGIFTLLGSLFSFGGIFSIGSALRTRLGPDGIHVIRYLFGVVVSRKFLPRNTVRELTVKESMSSSDGQKKTTFYAIKAITRDDKKSTIAFRLKGKREAEILLESIRMLSGYPC